MYLLGVSCTVSSDLSLYYCIKKYSIQKLLLLIMPCAKKIKMYIITSLNTQIISDLP